MEKIQGKRRHAGLDLKSGRKVPRKVLDEDRMSDAEVESDADMTDRDKAIQAYNLEQATRREEFISKWIKESRREVATESATKGE